MLFGLGLWVRGENKGRGVWLFSVAQMVSAEWHARWVVWLAVCAHEGFIKAERIWIFGV